MQYLILCNFESTFITHPNQIYFAMTTVCNYFLNVILCRRPHVLIHRVGSWWRCGWQRIGYKTWRTVDNKIPLLLLQQPLTSSHRHDDA